ncbi:hypothetical protein [Endozoicomonas sp. Mp262]|uniref:hypothetical protein n=1 Tax=Endozoicomonas sp. Mp262 TaxID=2919499 RepID=UPI0021D9AF10
MAFFPFLYNTIQKRANDRNNKRFWLPGVLQGIDNPNKTVGGKLLPLRGQDWALGKIEGQAGQTITLSIIGAARSLVESGQSVGPDMADPYAALGVNEGEIIGLDNLFVYPDPVTTSGAEGYTTTIALKFNEYDDLETLGLKGKYQLDQKIEVTGPEAGQKQIQTITGTGTFSSTITNAKLTADVDIKVTGSGSNRQLDVRVTKLNLLSVTEGEKPVFTTHILSIDSAEPGYEDIWLNISNNAFNSPSASDSMLKSVTETLNQPDNLDSLSQTMSSQLVSLLNSLLGEPGQLPDDTGQKVTNPADLYLLDRTRAALNDSGSNLYLPKQILSIKSPQLEPLSIDQIDIGTQNIGGLNWEPNQLSQVMIIGLANNLAPADQIKLQEPVLSLLSDQGALETSTQRSVDGEEIPPAPLNITAAFSFTPPGIDPVKGTLKVNVNSSNLDIRATASGSMLDELVITFSYLALLVKLSEISIELDITSDSMMNSFAKTLVNKDSVKQQLVDQVNKQLESNLANISKQVTESVVKFATSALQ